MSQIAWRDHETGLVFSTVIIQGEMVAGAVGVTRSTRLYASLRPFKWAAFATFTQGNGSTPSSFEGEKLWWFVTQGTFDPNELETWRKNLGREIKGVLDAS